MAKDTHKRNLTWQQHVEISENVRKDERWIRELEADRAKTRKQLDEIEINLAYAKLWFAKHCLKTDKRETGRKHLVEGARLAASHLTLFQSLDFFSVMFEHGLEDDLINVLSDRKAEIAHLSDPDTIGEIGWLLIEAMWSTHRFDAYELYRLIPKWSHNDPGCTDICCQGPPAA